MTSLSDAVSSVDRVERKDDDKLMIFGADAVGDGVVAKTAVDDAGGENQDGGARIIDGYAVSRLAYEAAIYTQVVNPMMADDQCANLVTSAAWVPSQPIAQYYFDVLDLVRDGFAAGGGEDNFAQLRDFKDAVEAQAGGAAATVSTLVTLVPPNFGGSVWDQFDTLRDDWRLPFQMAYTLAACELNGLSHNDNHLSNWLVSLGMPAVYYAVSASQFVPVAGLRVWLYDWDLGYAEALGPNPDLGSGSCRELGMCNAVSGLHDLAQMACSLDWFGPGDACSGDSEYMWERLRRAVCARAPDYQERAGICHIDLASLEWPAGINNAIEYVLQLPEVAAQVVDVATMDRGTAAALLRGQSGWVAHAGIDRDALMQSLRNRVNQSRKRPLEAAREVSSEVPSEAATVGVQEGATAGEPQSVGIDAAQQGMAVKTNFPWASQGAPKISRVDV